MRPGARWLLPIALVAVCAAQTSSAISREGQYWIQTTAGAVSLEGSDRLEVSVRGPVFVQGEARRDAGYTLTKRVRARDAAKARLLLEKIQVKAARRGGALAVDVVLPPMAEASASLRLAAPRTLRETALESQGDSIQAFDLDGALRADSRGGRLQLDRIGGDVVVRTGGGQVHLGKVGGNVLCFSGGGQITADVIGGEAALNTEGGEILVREAKGLVRAATAGGNIRVEQAGRGVTAAARAGLIDILKSGGPVLAQTEAGAIRIRSASNVECQAVTGAIQLSDVYGGLRVSTRMGSIVADLAAKPLQDSVLATGSGDITVFIPSNLPVTVQMIGALTGGHRVFSDFPEVRSREGQSEMQGVINGGGPILRLAASGTIYLRRQK